MEGSTIARPLDYFGLLVAASVGALLSGVVTAICIKYEERGLAWVWAAAFFSCALAAAYFLGRMCCEGLVQLDKGSDYERRIRASTSQGYPRHDAVWRIEL